MIRLDLDKTMTLDMSKPAYERFGMEGRRLGKKGSKFRVFLPLTSPAFALGQKKRQRLLECAAVFFQGQSLQWNLVCSDLAWNNLGPMVADLSKVQIEIERRECLLSVPLPMEMDQRSDELKEALEDHVLWMGAITTNSNLLTEPHSSRPDPFISTCSLPTGTDKLVSLFHYQFSSGDIPMLNTRVVELIESIGAVLTGPFYLGGTDGNASGFMMRIDPSLDYFYCSTVDEE